MSLKKIDPGKIMQKTKSHKPYKDWRKKKENEGMFSWTLCLYGTPEMAKEARLTQKAYWDQIIQACYLDHKDPVNKWNEVQKQMDDIIKKMDKLKAEKFHIEGEDVDLWITLGEKRKWIGGRGCNIPSFEIFTSPDWRGTEGWIRFNQPLYVYGNLIEGVELEFIGGRVVRSSAKKNHKVLKSMIETEGADKVGEFSLTDKRFSHITKFMAETLYDENAGGEYGNTHIALGSSYHDCYKGDSSKMKKGDWKKLGFNDSVIHTDIVSTTDRTVTAHFKNGKKKVIYKNGQFVI
jgi:aminopeptidase